MPASLSTRQYALLSPLACTQPWCQCRSRRARVNRQHPVFASIITTQTPHAHMLSMWSARPQDCRCGLVHYALLHAQLLVAQHNHGLLPDIIAICSPPRRQYMRSRWAHHQVSCCCAASDATPPSKCPSSQECGSCKHSARTTLSTHQPGRTTGTHGAHEPHTVAQARCKSKPAHSATHQELTSRPT
jgi:hypothetical protein